MDTNFIGWEMLEKPIDICLLGGDYLLENNINLFNIIFKRNENYELTAILNGFIDENIGGKVNNFFKSIENNKIIIKSLNGHDITFQYNVRNYIYHQVHYSVKLDILYLRIGEIDEEKVELKSRWYINGSDLILLRNPIYTIEKGSNFKRLNDVGELIINADSEFNHFVSSYFVVKPDTLNQFIVSKISNKFNPQWSKKMSIDFFREFGFHSKEQINLIENVLSFAFGRSLIDIGESHFDKNGSLIYYKAYSPRISHTINLKYICDMGANCPLFYTFFDMRHENDLAFIIGKCEESNVNYYNVFNYLRESFNLPPLSEIVLIAGALEFLVENWLENNSSGKHEHMPKEDFENLISDELNSCHEKFEEYGVKRIDDLMDNIKGAYKKQGSKKLDLFFDELGITLGKIEESAIQYRHTPAHGRIMNLKMARKFSLRTLSYRLLLNRCILKSLNFEGYYWDFFSKSYKNLSESIDKEDFNKVRDSVKFIKDN